MQNKSIDSNPSQVLQLMQNQVFSSQIEQPERDRIDKQQEQNLIQSQQTQPNNTEPIATSCHPLDKLLIAISILFMAAAIISQLYLQHIRENLLQAQLSQQANQQKWSKIYTDNYLKQYQEKLLIDKAPKLPVAQHAYNYWHQIQQKIGKLKANKCGEYRHIDYYDQMQDIVNPYQQQQQEYDNKQVDEQILKIQEEDGDAYLTKYQKQLKIQQQRQQDQINKINANELQLQKQVNSLKGITVAGINQHKIAAAKQYKKLTVIPPWQSISLSTQQYEYYNKVYKIGEFSKQLPFCIVVPTFNNEQNDRYKLNIDSIVQQNYSNYHVVIIDDASTDRTGMLIDQHVKIVKEEWAKRGKSLNINVYHNEQQRRAMPNLRKAALEYCKPNEIFVIVDGDDQLIGRQVLKLFNSQFQAKNAWFAYSNFMSFVGNVGFSRPFKAEVVEENRYRQANFVTSHLRAFYTQLMRLIKEQDLKDGQGQYFRAANDVAICIPILEMAHTRVTYIPEITYLYNSNTGLNNHMVRLKEQIDNSRLIRKRNKYFPLDQLKFEENNPN